jgi:hypothetical protein
MAPEPPTGRPQMRLTATPFEVPASQVSWSSYENRGSGGGRGCCGCQNIKHFLQTVQSLTLRDRVRLSYACSPLPGATKGNAFEAARIKLPCGVKTPPWNNTISKRSRDHLVMRRAGPPVAQRGTRCHFLSWRCGPGPLANYHVNSRKLRFTARLGDVHFLPSRCGRRPLVGSVEHAARPKKEHRTEPTQALPYRHMPRMRAPTSIRT